MRGNSKWVYVVLVMAVLCGLGWMFKQPGLSDDDRMVFVMLAAVTLYGLYWMVQIPGAINQFDKVRRNRPKRMINGKEYVWLTNIVREVTSMMDSRPQEVCDDFIRQGYELVVLEEAWDVWGKEKCPELRSVWGRMRPSNDPRRLHIDLPD